MSPPSPRRKAARRVWIIVGEVMAVLAVIISALTLWNSYSDRKQDVGERTVRDTTLLLTATVEDDGKWLALKAASDEQTIQSQQVEFPASLGVDVADTAGEPRIEAHWFDEALKRARAKSGRPDDSRGDERMPVAITTRYLAYGHLHEDRALYDIGYSISGRLISGHNVKLRGLSLVRRVSAGELQPQLDARWAGIMPTSN